MPSAGILALKALGWGLLAASSFMIGGFIGITVETSPRTRAIMMAFGGGALLYAAVIEGLQDATDDDKSNEERWVVVGSSLLGALVFVGLEWGLEAVKDKLGLNSPEDVAIEDEVGDAAAIAYQQMGLGGRFGELHAAVQGRALLSKRSRNASTKCLARAATAPLSTGASLNASLNASTKSQVSTPKRPILPSLNERVEMELMSTESGDVAEANTAPPSVVLSEGSRVTSVDEQRELERGKQASVLFVAASFIDAIPESLVIGIYSNDGDPSTLVTFVLGVFLAQLPTAMSAAEKMLMSGVSPARIMMMLAPITIWTGLGAMLGSFIFSPDSEGDFGRKIAEAAMEGLAGGMLLSLVANTILPEAFAEAGSKGSVVGFCTMLGFLSLMIVAVLISYYE